MIYRTLVTCGFLLLTTALCASAANIELQKTKLQLMSQIDVKLPLAHDGTLLIHSDELENIKICMKRFVTLIHRARSTAACNLIQQKLDLTKVLIHNRMLSISNFAFADNGSGRILYDETIPTILALPALWSPPKPK